MNPVDAYIDAAPAAHRAILRTVRETILAAVPPGATETMSYNMPAYRLNGVLIWFGAFKDHCSVFPGAEVIAKLAPALEGYTTTKGAVHFTAQQPLPADLLAAMVHARVRQIAEQKRSRPPA